MSEVINLIKNNPDSYVYLEAVEILCKKLDCDYSFILQIWDHDIPKDTKYPKILISTSDEAHRLPVQASDPSFVHIFKQYIPMCEGAIMKVNNVSPLPLCHLDGFKNHNIPISERQYDWSWMGQYDPYSRGPFKQAVDNVELLRHNDTKHVLWYQGWNNGAPMEEYTNVMNNTKIALVPAGSASAESFRFFEAMMCGCVVLNTGLPDTPFYKDSPYFKINNWLSLNDTLSYLLQKEEEIENYSQKAKLWYKEFCTPEGIATYMLKRINYAN